jgi:hydroxylaminobenzene mutase
MSDARRRVLWHGTLQVLLGLATGGVLQSFASPRLGLAAHVGGMMNGTLVMVVGVAWSELAPWARASHVLFWSLVGSGYANWLGLALAAAFGTTRTTPLLGDGIPAAAWQEAVVAILLAGGALVTLAAFAVVLMAFGRRAADRS